MKRLTLSQVRQFRRTIYSHYSKYGRSLPWRKTKDAYHILVSEVMLQQTQVDRVVPKYKEFLKTFPTAWSLATAPLSRVLKEWSGLGYNRRAVALKKCAEEIVRAHKGRVPDTLEELDALTGIGHHTAGAIMAFAFNKSVIFIETNIRSVYIHHFLPKRKKVSDDKLMPLIEQTVDTKDPRRWYSALMDYGSSLKKQVPNPSRRSAHHTRQSRFEGSNRQLRGAILRKLMDTSATQKELARRIGVHERTLSTALRDLVAEGMLYKKRSRIAIME